MYYVPLLHAHFYIDKKAKESGDVIKSALTKGDYWERHVGKIIRYFAEKRGVAVDVGARLLHDRAQRLQVKAGAVGGQKVA